MLPHPDDARYIEVREGLVFLYRRAGREEAAVALLYNETGVCEHLNPAEQHLRDGGARLYSVGRPWSDN